MCINRYSHSASLSAMFAATYSASHVQKVTDCDVCKAHAIRNLNIMRNEPDVDFLSWNYV